MKSVRCFLSVGLQIEAAKPIHYFHQTLSFPQPVYDAAYAKTTFNRFIKATNKWYRKYGMVILYVQERRANGAVHYHVCFTFFDPSNLPFAASRMERDFRTDIFERWDKTIGGGCVHPANQLRTHTFDFESLEYLVKTVEIPDLPPDRKKTEWWGKRNIKMLPKATSNSATKQEITKAVKKLFSSPDEKPKDRTKQNSECDTLEILNIAQMRPAEFIENDDFADWFESLEIPEPFEDYEAQTREAEF